MSSDQQQSSGSEGPRQIAGALTYPQSSSQNAALTPNQPRQPRDLQGLLRFAMEATKAEDAPGNSTLGPMDEERRKFLEEALKSMTVDVGKVIQKSIDVLTDKQRITSIQADDELPEDVQLAFSNLSDTIDQIDLANDFHKMGGYAVFPVCWASNNDEIRAGACDLLAELCQNNPYCQGKAVECGLLSVLVHMAGSERALTVLNKTIYALSCLCRECEAACRGLVAEGGCSALCQLLREELAPLWVKVTFFLSYLCRNVPAAKQELIKCGVVSILANLVRKGRSRYSEQVLSCLLALVEDMDKTILEQCRDQDLDLKNSLERYLQDPEMKGNTPYLEEKEYCEELLKRVFGRSEHLENADR